MGIGVRFILLPLLGPMAGRPPVMKSDKRTTKRKLKLMINAKETRTALALLFAPLVKAGDPVVPCRAFYFLWVSPWWQMHIPIQDNHSQSNLSEIIGTCLLPVVRRVSEQISTTACPGHAVV